MIQIVMKPVPGEGVVHGETLYTALFNGADIGMKVRALRASHAEEKVMEVFRHSIDKVGGTLLVDYNLEQWKKRKCNGKAQEPAPEEGAAHEEPGVRDEEVPELPRFPSGDGDVDVRPPGHQTTVRRRPERVARQLEHLVGTGDAGAPETGMRPGEGSAGLVEETL